MHEWIIIVLTVCYGATAQGTPGDAEREAAAARVHATVERVEAQWHHRPETGGSRSGAADGGALPVLIQGLKSNDPYMRLRALEGLAQTDDSGRAGAFIDAPGRPFA